MKKKEKADKISQSIKDIKTPRQLASQYADDNAELENFFVKHRLIFFKRLEDVPFKGKNDILLSGTAKKIVKLVKEKISPDDIVSNAEYANRICLAFHNVLRDQKTKFKPCKVRSVLISAGVSKDME